MFTSLTEQKVGMIERSEIDYMLDRMNAIKERPGNPEGVEIRHFGQAVALYSKAMPWQTFNTVKGISDDEIGYIDDILAFYRERKRKAQFEIVPSRVSSALLKKLAEKGLYQSGFHASLYYSLDGNPSLSGVHSRLLETGIRIKEVEADEFIAYATIHCRSTGLPDNGIEPVAANNRVLHGRPGWTFFMALVEEVPAAAGVMYSHNGTASLTFAGTLPEFRNRGLHQGLIFRRMEEAVRRDCKLAVSQAGFVTQSHRNMEKAGMKLGYVKAMWNELD